MAKTSKKTQAQTHAQPQPAVETQAQVAPEAETQTAAAREPVQLTVADLQLLGRIIDLASRRGAFQAAELSQVGEAFNKLAGFLSYVESVQQAEKSGEDADSETPVA